ncbi:MAG TPA: TA system VapC family ribonuclease toxin [Bryobacteraceae bacterium]|nr:TA system VapC family ribonuclease toxin [Bryobacteraceae bacterium]
MILLDANLLIYAYDSVAPEHARARSWLERTFSSSEAVGLSWITILAFLRISTSRRYESDPMRTDEAASVVTSWVSLPNVVLVSPAGQHWRILSDLLAKSRARGALIMDAHLAALAIEHGATLCTNDRDFLRCPGLKVEFPLQ